jgi:phosphoribosylformylglycinamidine cyclo-ligase
MGATIDPGAWTVPPLFTTLQGLGSIDDGEMFRAFNMGIGLIIACAAERVDELLDALAKAGEGDARAIGRVEAGDGTVRYGREGARSS